MSDISATAVFTLRDLNRQPAKVLDAVRKFGSAEVRTRGGEVFVLAVKQVESDSQRTKKLPDFESRWKKLRESGHLPPSPSENDQVNRIIAGEE